ncbi:MAG: asparagine synthase-related protein [Proteobacteria bacterium]|nr:asparagine synthase-related protein [Pseudomonadota bacterium]
MLRYIAFAWNPEVAETGAFADTLRQRVRTTFPEWTFGLDKPGLRVFHNGAASGAWQVYTMERDGGVVLGRLFRRNDAADAGLPELDFPTAESEKLKRSRGKRLIEGYWGRYVALIREAPGARLWILRDPTGAVPCFITRTGDVRVICSHVDDCAALGLVDPSVNWDHVAAYLWFDRLVTPDTGLRDVREVNAGERLEIGPDGMKSDFLWCPDRFCRAPFVGDRQQASRELRRTIEQCVDTWASCFKSVLHELSGGLDSAIVLAGLSRARQLPDLVCENHFARNAESDERAFAREAANAAGVPLIELPISRTARPLDRCFEPTKVATPAHTVFVPETQEAKERLVRSHRVEAVFSGRGGDHFFQRSRNVHIGAEYARHHGVRGDFFRVVSDTSRFTDKPIWSVLATAVLSGVLRMSANPYDIVEAPPLAGRRTRDAVHRDAIRHPWVDSARNLPGSKRQQIFNVIDSQAFRHMPDHYADIVHPLISQPIIELCLRIPSYVLTYDGIDRALVRQAFRGAVPARILARTTKGATTGYFVGLLVRNVAVLREYLLDGLLSDQGLLDRDAVAEALTERSLIRDGTSLSAVLSAFRAEIWARSWADCDRRAGPRRS